MAYTVMAVAMAGYMQHGRYATRVTAAICCCSVSAPYAEAPREQRAMAGAAMERCHMRRTAPHAEYGVRELRY